MTAATLGLFERDDEPELTRWGVAAGIVLAGHVALVASYVVLSPPHMRGNPETPAVLIELAPVSVGPVSDQEIAPGPEMQEAPPPEPEIVEPPPPETPVVAAPIERPKPPPKPDVKRVEKKPPAPRTTAPARAQREAPAAAAPRVSGAASASEMADWRSTVSAHLQRYKQYPSAARTQREEGVVVVAFSVDRNGHVLSQHITRSSGLADLDQEVLAMLRRAQPLPAFPPSMTQSRVDLTVPIRFSLR
jgi:protein TonB